MNTYPLPDAFSIPPDSFPHSAAYRRLLPESRSRVREADPTLDPFSERHLHCVWFDDRLRPTPLRTVRGEELRILSPGRWNLESGPDFLDAEWMVGGRRVAGDVEIHIRPMDWRHHGHPNDLRYRNVRLHVCYEEGTLPDELLPHGCEEVSLKPSLESRSHFFFDRIDTSAYPWDREAAHSGLKEMLTGLDDEGRGRVLEAAGQERLRRKTLRIAGLIRAVGSAQAIYQALMRGLGYKLNADAAERLAGCLPLSRLRPLAGENGKLAYALLLGCAGLLPRDVDGEGARVLLPVRRLWDLWWPHQEHVSGNGLRREDWRLDHCRPGNHPARRLMAAARWASLPVDLEETFAPGANEPNVEWIRRCMETFQSPVEANGTRIVGPARGGALFLNAVLPWRMAISPERPSEDLWRHLPSEPMNSNTRRTAHALFGPDGHPRLFRGGLRRQGLLQFHEDFGV